MTEPGKRICEDCYWKGKDTEVLTAPNPFAPDETIHGCPKCSAVDTIILVCDEPGCWSEVTVGCKTPGGYRQTCSEHAPKEFRQP